MTLFCASGNSLYHEGFNAKNAPGTLRASLDTLDIDRAKSRFGFDKDRKVATQGNVTQAKVPEQTTSDVSAAGAMVKQEGGKTMQLSCSTHTPRTQYAGNIATNHSKMTTQTTANKDKSYVTPGGNELRHLSKVATSAKGNTILPEALALPSRPGTSRGGDMSPMSAYIANFDGAPSATRQLQSIASSLKRKSEAMGGRPDMMSSSPKRNPYY
jgi:hypothetical protein